MKDLAWVAYEMLRRGHSEPEIRKVLGENFFHAFSKPNKLRGLKIVNSAPGEV